MNGPFFASHIPIRGSHAEVPYSEMESARNDDGWISLEARAVDTILHFAWVLENHVHAEFSQKTDSDDSRILIQSVLCSSPLGLCVPTLNIPLRIPPCSRVLKDLSSGCVSLSFFPFLSFSLSFLLSFSPAEIYQTKRWNNARNFPTRD